MMTIAQVRQTVGQSQGLPATFNGSILAYQALTPLEQVTLTRGVIEYIRAHPGDFTPAQVTTANTQYSQSLSLTIEDASWNPGLFFQELENGALSLGEDVASVGTGIGNTVNIIGKLLPVAALVAIAVFAWPYIRQSITPPK